MLIQPCLSVVDSRIDVKDLRNGKLQFLAGDVDNPSSNFATGFDRQDNCVLFVSNQLNGDS